MTDIYSKGNILRKPGGWMRVFDAITGKVTEHDTITCCHCNNVVVAKPGVKLGFCNKCDHLTCSNPKCHTHYAFEQKLTDYEKGKLLILD